MTRLKGLEQARRLLAEAHRVCVLTGAGISAESGVPTFRGPEGLWRTYRPEELATPEAFARDPRLVWEWYEWRRELIRECRPNAGHESLARMALAGGQDVRILTQNVDGLHEQAAREVAAGLDPSPALPLELHGSIFRVKCTGCGYRRPQREPLPVSSFDLLPRCPHCGALLRPDVVWFGEPLNDDQLRQAYEAARRADLCLVVGTSALVHPAASLPLATLRGGGVIVEVNTAETALSSVAAVSLRGKAALLLPLLEEGGR